MPFLKDFEVDGFISYAHVDDHPLEEGQPGWVTNLHNDLQHFLNSLLAEDASLYHDRSKMRGNDSVDETLAQLLSRAGVFIPVLTKRFLNSGYCLKELNLFHAGAEQHIGVSLGNKSRIFKVMRKPMPFDEHPPELRGLPGYEFFQFDPDTGVPRELSAHSDYPPKWRYFTKVEDLANDIGLMMEEIAGEMGRLKVGTNGGAPRAQAPAASPVFTVYLAETTSDLVPVRDSIKRELHQRGYRVLPDCQLPLSDADYRAAVREDLWRSDLSIHLVGGNYGIIPEAADSSVVSIQNELAAERSHDRAFTRIVWMPPDLEAREERQQRFIDTLRNDSNAQHGAELLQTNLEDLKTVVQDKLTALARPDAWAAPAASGGNPSRIYLIHDARDFEQVGPVYKYLFDQGYEVLTPLMEGDEAQIYANHKESLQLCDAVVVYCGNAGEDWVKSKQADLRKLPGLGRTKPLLAKAFYIGPPATPYKMRFRTHEALVIRQEGEFAAEPLRPLLAQLLATKGGL